MRLKVSRRTRRSTVMWWVLAFVCWAGTILAIAGVPPLSGALG